MNTDLNRENIEKLLEKYGLSQVKDHQLLKGGSENTNYLVHTEKGKLVVSICEQKSAKEAEELALLLEHLAKHNFATSVVIRTSSDEPISYWKGKPLMVKVFLSGSIIQDLPLSLLHLIGKELGKLHQVEAPNYLPRQINYGLEQFREVEKYAPDSTFHHWLKEIEQNIEPYLSSDLPKALIHSDLFYSNVIVSEDGKQTTIMDFEEATFYYRVFDLGMAIVGLCSFEQKVNLRKVEHLLQGYEIETKLNPDEKLSLKAFTIYAAAAMTFWRHKNFNHVKPDLAMADHYLELKGIADFVRELPEDCFTRFL